MYPWESTPSYASYEKPITNTGSTRLVADEMMTLLMVMMECLMQVSFTHKTTQSRIMYLLVVVMFNKPFSVLYNILLFH